ncbi:MAG TPA: hypothetical protein VNQ73_01825 [Ilumatobacter sp.]|nr:hypothetical protein [Ilumatobacter sp.]
MSLALLRKVVEALDATAIPHMLTGSFASNEYGELRSTQDIDLVIDPTPTALDAFLDAFPVDDYYFDRPYAQAELTRRGMFNVIDVRLGWKVDLVIRKDRPFSVAEFARRRITDAFGFPLSIATAEDVVISKLEWARRGESQRQLSDAAAILRARDDLDLDYVERWATELGITEELTGARELAG